MPPKLESCVIKFMNTEHNKTKWPNEKERQQAAYAICNTAIKAGDRRGYLFELSGLQFEDDSSQTWVHLLPYGAFEHPVFGEIEVSAEKVADFVKNFKKNVRGVMLDVDFAHKRDVAKGSKAAGWIINLEQRVDGLWGLVSWTPEAQKEVDEGAWKYMSVEYQDIWCNSQDKCFDNVLFGAALTNRPFMKEISPINMDEFGDLFTQPEGGYAPEEAHYREASDSAYRCANCAFFQADSKTCMVVTGDIDEDWTCRFFEVMRNESMTTMYSEEDESKYSIYLRDFTAAQRKKAASSGAAMPDGSFPIENRSDLVNALRLLSQAKDKAAAKAHILKRARSLGLMSIIKASKAFTDESFEEELLLERLMVLV